MAQLKTLLRTNKTSIQLSYTLNRFLFQSEIISLKDMSSKQTLPQLTRS